MPQSKYNWNLAIAETIKCLDSSLFAGKLVNLIKMIAPFDHCVMFAYFGQSRPLDLFDDFPPNKRRVFVTDYQAGPYLLDPFYLKCMEGSAEGLHRLKDFAPDRFYQGEYFRSYYVQTGLTEELGYFIPLPGNVTAVISLMRSGNSPQFSNREFRDLKGCEPIISALSCRHWRELTSHFSQKSSRRDLQKYYSTGIDFAFNSFGKDLLTNREREIVEYVLKGYSSQAIGKTLAIAPGTVRIHRKNIYAKLGINSQGELFSRFIEFLRD